MILLIIAIAVSIIFLTVEIPAFLRYHNEEDFLLVVIFGLFLLIVILGLFLMMNTAVSYFWR